MVTMAFRLLLILGLSSLKALLLVCHASTYLPTATQFFGDSFADTGNNNYILTLVKADIPPYGLNFAGGIPTGRFSDGRIFSDFLASGVGVKDFVPAYFDPKLQEQDLFTGVSFASSGTGIDNFTAATLSVIPLFKELEAFREYIARLTALRGPEGARTILNNSIVFISIGTNDFIANYFLTQKRASQFTVPEYVTFLLQAYSSFIKELYRLGIRRIGLLNLPPLGCLPIERTLQIITSKGECSAKVNKAAQTFNIGLLEMVNELKLQYSSSLMITSLDYYSMLSDIIDFPDKYGFIETRKAWCATGSVELGGLCKADQVLSKLKGNPENYVFFDSVHLTERAYYIISHGFLTHINAELLS